MGFFADLKANKAMMLQGKGRTAEAMQLFEEAIAGGTTNPRALLSYALLLLRADRYEECKALLVKAQKAPGLTPQLRSQLIMDYAVCCHKLGETDKGVRLLERQHERTPTGLTYQTLGYLYVEQYDQARKEEFLARTEEEAAPDEDDRFPTPEKEALPREEQWRLGVEKTLEFNQGALEYDDEDAIFLDNLGQTYYRVLGDKEKAKEYFDKAIAIRPGQIDTLWFLSRYALEAGNTAAAVEYLERAQEGRFSPLNYCTKAMVDAELTRLGAGE